MYGQIRFEYATFGWEYFWFPFLVSSFISLFSLGIFNHRKPLKCEIKLLLSNPQRKSCGFKNIRMHSVIAQVLVGPSKQLKQIFKIEHNIVKNPLAIYKRGRGFEFGATEKQIQIVVRAGFEPETAGLRVRHADHSTTLPPKETRGYN